MFDTPVRPDRLLSSWPFEVSAASDGESSAEGAPEIRRPESTAPLSPARLTLVSQPAQKTEVLLLLGTGSQTRRSTIRDGASFRSPHDEGRSYVVKSIVLDSVEQLIGRCWNSDAPAVLLVDIALIPNAEAVHHLQRRLPATEWLLVYDALPANGLDATLLQLFRGCLRWSDSDEHVVRALNAVAGGRLWFPRSVLESLYLSLLRSHAGDAAGPDSVFDTPLTAREAEVHGLMRHGMTNRQISNKLGISVNTVKKHLAHVFEKRGLRGRRQDYS